MRTRLVFPAAAREMEMDMEKSCSLTVSDSKAGRSLAQKLCSSD